MPVNYEVIKPSLGQSSNSILMMDISQIVLKFCNVFWNATNIDTQHQTHIGNRQRSYLIFQSVLSEVFRVHGRLQHIIVIADQDQYNQWEDCLCNEFQRVEYFLT